MRLLTEEYREQIRAMEDWGGNGWKWADAVIKLISKYKIKTALDYGCGQGALKKKVMELSVQGGFIYTEYDPANKKKERIPGPAELITCTDVLEHIEPQYIDDVVMHLMSLIQKVGFIVIALKDCTRLLPNGNSAHLIIQNAGWWIEKISQGILRQNGPLNSIERLFSRRLDNKKQLILVIKKITEKELLDKT